MEWEKVLGKLHELTLAGVSFWSCPPTKVSRRINIANGASLLLVVTANTSGYVIHSVLEIIGDDPHCSYVSYSRDAIGRGRFWSPKSNIQVRYWKESLTSAGIADGFLKGPTGDQFMLTAFGLGSREKKPKTNRRLTKIKQWHESNFHNPPSSWKKIEKLGNLHMVVTGLLVLSSAFWCSQAGTPHHPDKMQASS